MGRSVPEGLASFLDIDLDETAIAVKTTAGRVYGWYIYNNATATRYVKFYDVAQGSVTVGTTTPTFVLALPAESAANQEFGLGVRFSTAITFAATTDVGSNGAPSANDVVISLFYT